MFRVWSGWLRISLGLIAALVVSGCVGAPAGKSGSARNRAGAARGPDGTPIRAPFYYEPLNVRNGCFVDSVRLYDAYSSRKLGGKDGWVKVLQWGHREAPDKIGFGHAVAVFTWRGRLWTYDVNHAFTQLAAPVERREDLTDVTPEIFAKYPEQIPVLVTYREDGFQRETTKVPEHLFYHASRDVREATRVASELGRHRPVRVVEFVFPERGAMKTGAAAAFVFGNRLCLYLPARGTQILRSRVTSANDLRLIAAMLRQLYPGVAEVKWHGGGYWFYPPKK